MFMHVYFMHGLIVFNIHTFSLTCIIYIITSVVLEYSLSSEIKRVMLHRQS